MCVAAVCRSDKRESEVDSDRLAQRGIGVAHWTLERAHGSTSEQWKDKNGEKQERTEWHRVVLFGRQAEIAGEYLKKGRSVYIEGRLQTRKYTDKDGVEKYSTEIVADRMQLLGSRDSAGGGDVEASGGGGATRAGGSGGGKPTGSGPKRTNADDLDDDIPF